MEIEARLLERGKRAKAAAYKVMVDVNAGDCKSRAEANDAYNKALRPAE